MTSNPAVIEAKPVERARYIFRCRVCGVGVFSGFATDLGAKIHACRDHEETRLNQLLETERSIKGKRETLLKNLENLELWHLQMKSITKELR